MPEPTTPVSASATPPFPDRPRCGWFGGIMEGHRGDEATLRKLVDDLNRLGLGQGDLEIEGGRFSLLLAEDLVPGDRITPELLAEFEQALDRIVSASPRPEAVESTLNCTLLFADQAQECLYGVVAGGINSLTRTRPIKETDRRLIVTDPGPDPLLRISRSKALLIGGLLVAVFLALAWQKNYFHRLFKAGAETIDLRTGAFGSTLSLDLENHWGSYRITISRGGNYPATKADLERLQKGATSTVDRAAINAVANGLTVYAQLLNKDDKMVAWAPLELNTLLVRKKATITCTLPGRIDAKAILLALDRGDGDDE